MLVMPNHTYEYVSRILRYEDGLLYWTENARRKHIRNTIAGCKKRNGYVYVKIQKKIYGVHQVVWLLCTGNWPSAPVDHIDRVRVNNKFENLRLCTPSQNQMNRAGSNEIKGVTRHTSGRFQAQIQSKGKNHYLGLFKTEKEAGLAYDAAAKRMFGEFAYLNFGTTQ